MSADLIERLRLWGEKPHEGDPIIDCMSDDLAEAADALASQAALIAEAREEWRDIETAPRDGTAILVYAPCDQAQRHPRGVCGHGFNQYLEVHEVRWIEPDDEPMGYWGDAYDYVALLMTKEPTHWRPLPEPPRSLQRTPAPEGKDGGA